MGETLVIQATGETQHGNDVDPAYQEQMIAKAEAGLGAQVEAPLLAGKYKTEEDLQKGILELAKRHDGGLEAFYKSLESGIGKKVETPEPPKADQPKDEPPKEEPPKTEQAPLPIDLEKYTVEFTSQGQLTEESRTELRNFGIKDEVIDGYLKDVKAAADLAKAFAFNEVGGEENYYAMINFAAQSLSPQEKDAYNAELTNPDLGKRREAIKNLWAKYTEANPQFLEGNPGGGTTTDSAFRSEAEWRTAMKDPRYMKDAAYRESVMRRLERSKF
jgi:hypothetical protein